MAKDEELGNILVARVETKLKHLAHFATFV
jgi:hypothetical protein